MSEHVVLVENLVKEHGGVKVLDDVSFTARPGRVTAFLGQNGAGKSSALRILLGLDRAGSGSATFAGVAYADLVRPLTQVGCVFDGLGGAKVRKVRTHLRIVAQSNGIAVSRLGEVLEICGMSHKANARLGGLSLGEGQRVGLAAALLGSPQYLVLDEPANGLDPGGILWIRNLLRDQAAAGTTVLMSSHLLREVEDVADDVVIIDHGRIVLHGEIGEVTSRLRGLEDVFFAV
ncbi:MAG: ABC transporter ATP-binding protein, partial [Arachnia sp.]